MFTVAFLLRYTVFQFKNTLLSLFNFLSLDFFLNPFVVQSGDDSLFTKGICSGDLSSSASSNQLTSHWLASSTLLDQYNQAAERTSHGGKLSLSHFLFIHFKWVGDFTLIRVTKHTLLSKELREIHYAAPAEVQFEFLWFSFFPPKPL